MRNWLSIYRGLLGLSVKEYTRDPIPTIFTFAMPLMFLVIFGVTFMMVGPKGSGNSLVYKVGVSHAGDGARARAIAARIDALQAFESIDVDEGASSASLEKRDIYMVVRVPADSAAPVAIEYVTQMEGLAEIAATQVQAALAPASDPHAVTMTGREMAGKKAAGYISFIMPALIAFALVQLCLYGTATPLVAAKERGTMRHYAVMPMPRSALLAAQISVRMVIAGLQVFLMVLLSVAFLKMTISGSLFALAGIFMLGAVMLISLGYALGGRFSSLAIATAVIAMLNLYVMAFGQIFMDLSGFAATKILLFTTPVAFLSDAIRQTVTGGAGAFSMGTNILVMLLWTVAGVLISVKTFNFKPARA
jgi:ABC-2 type transport system permease protein